MPSLRDVLASSSLGAAEREWLHDLVGDWQLLADLSFGDLVLWLPDGSGGWVVGAHVRPTTGVGIFQDDLVGQPARRGHAELLRLAWDRQEPVAAPRPSWHRGMPVREEAVPVVPRGYGRPVAVVTRHTSQASMRTPSRLEVTYLATAQALTRMLADGQFPVRSGFTGRRRGAPRVGDGVLRLTADGRVGYASPNAVSALHRLGYLGPVVGCRPAQVLPELLDRGDLDEQQLPVLAGRVPGATEVGVGGATITVRSIPLRESGSHTGAVLLVRDVSELRRREHELLTKDATIREIHHRVKNNLQSVAAVLRLQARRLDDPAARAALEDAVRRVGTIALVHDTLSHRLDDTVDFGDVAHRGLQTAIDVAGAAEAGVTGRVRGEFGAMCSEDATSVAMVLAELVHNAVEHGVGGRGGQVVVTAERHDPQGIPRVDGPRLTVTVDDDGPGLPEGFSPGRRGLGTQIVLSLVEDLDGRIDWSPGPDGGTRVRFTARLRQAREG